MSEVSTPAVFLMLEKSTGNLKERLRAEIGEFLILEKSMENH